MSFRSILAEIGSPEIYLVEPELFARLAWPLEPEDYGGAECVNGVCLITVNTWVKGWAIYGTQWHEVGHHVYPTWPEWKVRLWGYVMAHRRGGLGTAEYLYGHDISELKPRAELLRLARIQVEKLRGR